MFSAFFQRLLNIDRLLLVKSILSLWLLVYLAPGLLPDEAQYWVWSKHLATGYYSKPPGIAWLIAVSSSIFGDSIWGVRLPSIFLAWLGAYYVKRGLRSLGFLDLVAQSTARLMIFCPLMLLGSFSATTDVGLVSAWCALIAYLVEPKTPYRSFKLAMSAFLGMLFKPTVLVFVAMQLLRPKKTIAPGTSRASDMLAMGLGCALALTFFVAWNAQHDWVTFRHMQTQLFGSGSAKSVSQALVLSRPLALIAAQALLLSPYLTGLMGLSARDFFASCPSAPYPAMEPSTKAWMSFFARTSALALAWVFLASFFIKYQANWLAFIYPHLFYLLAAALRGMSALKVKSIVHWHVGIHSALFIGVIYLSAAQLHPRWPLSHTPWKLNPFRSAAGEEKILRQLDELPIDLSSRLLLSDKYQSVSQLTFYLKDHEVYWFNLHGARKNQFSFWPVPQSYEGQAALFIAIENEPVEAMRALQDYYRQRLAPYFDVVGQVQLAPLVEGKDVRTMLWIELEGYRGHRPPDPSSF